MLLISCEKEKLPTTPTVIKGLVVDENDKPVQEAYLTFIGEEQTGWLTFETTFKTSAFTKEDGSFTLSHVVPDKTDRVYLSIAAEVDSIVFYRPTSISFNNQAFQENRTLELSPSFFGDTFNVKIIVIKR